MNLPVKLAIVDRFHPSSLFASHQYLPWSSGSTESTVNTDNARISLILCLANERLFLNQVITGRGIPNASQLKFIFCPVAMFSRVIGWIRNLGFEGSAIENIIIKFPYNARCDWLKQQFRIIALPTSNQLKACSYARSSTSASSLVFPTLTLVRAILLQAGEGHK